MVVAVESVFQHPIPQGRVKQKLSSGGKYVSVNIGPVQILSNNQLIHKIYSPPTEAASRYPPPQQRNFLSQKSFGLKIIFKLTNNTRIQKAQRLAAERDTPYTHFVPQVVLTSSYAASEVDIGSIKTQNNVIKTNKKYCYWTMRLHLKRKENKRLLKLKTR
ncbi:hypothetical protein LXL04_017756 [Taraxacum kok-saghyz]